MSFTVAQRAREIGIRLALGACPRSLLGSVSDVRCVSSGSVSASVTGIRPADLGRRAQPDARNGLLLAVAAIILAVGLLAGVGQRAELTHPRLGHYGPTLSRWFVAGFFARHSMASLAHSPNRRSKITVASRLPLRIHAKPP